MLETSARGVREWKTDDEHIGFVYRQQSVDMILTLGNNTDATQERTEIRFVVENLDGEGDMNVDGDGWTCEGDDKITCTSTRVVEPGGIWPALPFTMSHTKGGQTEVTVTWGDLTRSVMFRYDTST